MASSVLALALVLAIPWIPGRIASIRASGTRKQEQDRAQAEPQRLGLDDETLQRYEEAYQQWLSRREDDGVRLEEERVQIENLSPKAFEQFVAELPSSALGGVQYFLGLAEHQLPNGSPQFFWDMISRLEGMLFQGLPGKVCALKNRGCAVEHVKALEQEAARLAESLQGLVAQAKELESFAQEHALRCAYEERDLGERKRRYLRPPKVSFLRDYLPGDSGHHGGDYCGDGGDGGDGGGGH